MFKHRIAFTLAEVLITLGIIGLIAALTIPTLINIYQERQMVTGLLKFNATLQQAVQLWKEDIGCHDDAYSCLASQGNADNDINSFNQIGQFLKIVSTATQTNSANWLPDNTQNYYGNIETTNYGKVAHVGCGAGAFLLPDGTTFSVDIDAAGFEITVDVNGKKPPNRIGKDTFPLFIGEKSGKDIWYYKYWNSNSTGLCLYQAYGANCKPYNADPTVGFGASPTSYVILNNKLPDFYALSQTVSGFNP